MDNIFQGGLQCDKRAQDIKRDYISKKSGTAVWMWKNKNGKLACR